jgi:hypothetical protein
MMKYLRVDSTSKLGMGVLPLLELSKNYAGYVAAFF